MTITRKGWRDQRDGSCELRTYAHPAQTDALDIGRSGDEILTTIQGSHVSNNKMPQSPLLNSNGDTTGKKTLQTRPKRHVLPDTNPRIRSTSAGGRKSSSTTEQGK
ncbi:hypothetical protein BaRGS_00026262 [Batillaria attramentaria]|uniref:Uncharacterized protein n=1 Tax=Batillaria attramentaria TaxID=370345 RepID=A0ABD0K6K1_9CAEN